MEGRDTETVELLREKYEARLHNLVALVLSTKDEINRDEVIGVMKGDAITQGFANQRTKEVWENLLAKERETTITSLITELSESKRTIRDLELQLAQSHRAVQTAEEKGHDLTRETEKLYEKASISSHNYEEIIKKRDSETLKIKSECECLSAEVVKLKAEIALKSSEIEGVYLDLEESTAANQQLQHDLESLTAQLDRAGELQRFRETVAGEYQDREDALMEKIRMLEEDNIRAGKEMRESQAAQIKLENALKQQTEAHKKQLDALSRVHTESVSSSEQYYESELQSLHTKLASSKLHCQELEMQLQESSRSLDSVKDRCMHEASSLRSELEREKTEAGRRRDELERHWAQREAEMTTERENEVDALHKHYKEIVIEKAKSMEREIGEEREQWKSAEKTLRDKIASLLANMQEKYIPLTEHEAILTDNEAIYAQNIRKMIADLEETADYRVREETNRAKGDLQQVIDLVSSKLSRCEAEKDSMTADNRRISGELATAGGKIAKLMENCEELDAELSDMQRNYSERMMEVGKANKEIEEMTFAMAEVRRESAELREIAGKAQSDVRSLQDRLHTQELSLKSQLNTQASTDREQIRLKECELEQCRSMNDQLNVELKKYKQLAKQMEEERDAAIAQSSQQDTHTQELIKTLRSEENDRTTATLRIHTETKDRLSATESALSTAVSDLNSLRAANSDLKSAKFHAESQLPRCQARIADLESAVKISKKQHKELKSKAEQSRKALKSIISKHTKLVRSIKQRYRTELNQLQTSIFQELQDYKKSLSTLVSRCLIGMDDRVMAVQRKHQSEVAGCQDQAESLQKRLDKGKTEVNDYIKSLQIEHESEVIILNEEKQALQAQLRTVDEERKALSFHLEKARGDVGRLETAARDMQEDVRRLQGEGTAGRERMKNEYEGKVIALQGEWKREIDRKEEELKREREALSQLRADLEAQHNSESSQLIALFKHKLTEKETALEAHRVTNKQQMEEISQLRSDIIHLKRRTEGPLVSLQSEVESLVEGLKLEQIRYRNQLVLKDKEIEELKNQLRKDTEMIRNITESRRFDDMDGRSLKEQRSAESEPRLNTRLSLSQLTPGRK